MASEQPHVKLVEIKGLFRQYHHRIPLQREDRVTILHGRNGVGKTVTLSLVAALLQGNYSKLGKYPFEKLRVEFVDGSFIDVAHVVRATDESPPPEKPSKSKKRSTRNLGKTRVKAGSEPTLEIRYAIAGDEPQSFFVSGDASKIAEAVAREVSWLRPVGQDVWVDIRSGEVFSAQEVVERYASMLPPSRRAPIVPAEARDLPTRLRMPVHFIEAQRLFRIVTKASPQYYGGATAVTSEAKQVAREIAERIKETDSTYRATSTRLDDSLPKRLFTPTPVAPIAEAELMRRADALEVERNRLRAVGLISDITGFNPSNLEAAQRAMFAVYLKDNEEKLSVFKDLADRAEILLRIINSKFSPKLVKLDKDHGYQAFSHDGLPLDLDSLSSGEQHELVLLHNLLFRVEPGALLLIDEPELSLHVTWQREFLAELSEIAKKRDFDAIVATHSPYIVGERRDLMVRLGEPEVSA